MEFNVELKQPCEGNDGEGRKQGKKEKVSGSTLLNISFDLHQNFYGEDDDDDENGTNNLRQSTKLLSDNQTDTRQTSRQLE